MIVTLLTDYGLEDDFVGVCHAVILAIHPQASIVDLTHNVPRHDIRRGALTLRDALTYAPVGVHVGVVDPQVGTGRRAVAARCADERILVGPDNGLLSLAWERGGGVVEAVDVSRSRHRLEPMSATFHGRDLFAPVAAHLAAGAELAEAGERIDPDELATIELPPPAVADGAVTACAIAVDRFGNVALYVSHDEVLQAGLSLGQPVTVTAAGRDHAGTLAQTFADVPAGDLIVYEDAYRNLALAINRGDAAAELGLTPDAEVRIARA